MDQKRIIITINRECGSGGGEIARLLGEKLGIKVYGRAFLEEVAKQFDTTMEDMDRIKAQKSNWWKEFCQLYQDYKTSLYTRSAQPEATPMNLYYAEEQLLCELAEQENCIIVGRADFLIFRDNPNAVNLLIMADRDARIARIARKQNLSDEEAAKVIDRIDKERDTYVKNVSGASRFDAHNYDLMVNVTGMSTESVATFLEHYIRDKFDYPCPSLT